MIDCYFFCTCVNLSCTSKDVVNMIIDQMLMSIGGSSAPLVIIVVAANEAGHYCIPQDRLMEMDKAIMMLILL